MVIKKIVLHLKKLQMYLLKQKIVRLVGIPCLLLLFWLIASTAILFTYNASFTILPYDHDANYTLVPNKGELYAGNTLKGEFRAQENNLGIISIRIQNFKGGFIKEDRLHFRIKEKGNQKWYYTHTYSGGQFHELMLFPFGFPVITDSKGKQYTFELESTTATEDNALTISEDRPQLISKYQYTLSDLRSNTQLLLFFVKDKLLYGLQNPEFYFSSLLYFLPFLAYIIWLSPYSIIVTYPFQKLNQFLQYLFVKKRLMVNVTSLSPLDYFIFLGTILESFLITSDSSAGVYILLLIWIFELRRKRYSSIASVVFALLLLLLVPFLISSNLRDVAIRVGRWAILFLLIGVFHMLLEDSGKNRDNKKQLVRKT